MHGQGGRESRTQARERRGPGPAARERRNSPASRVPSPPPPTWRDPWAWASVLALAPLLVRCAGAPLGEPVAEDFDFLRRSLFGGVGSLLDGGGSTAFWRPVAHQLYYTALGPVIVGAPRVVAALHALLLALGGLLFYRAFRTRMGGAAACAAAAFPALSESTRTLISWPSQFVDVGLYLFSALAVHEASRRRLPSALAAALVALLCKELAVVTVLLLPWLPGAVPASGRRRWLVATGALLTVWAGAYLGVRHAAHLALPHGIESAAAGDAAAPFARLVWALEGSARALASLPLLPGPHDGWALGAVIVFAAALAIGLVAVPGARARLAARRGWIAWGVAWFALATVALTPIYPLWQPNRSQFGATGAGVAAVVALDAVHPALAGGLVASRLLMLALAPNAATTISEEPPATGAFLDFAQLSRLQRFMWLTRTALAREYPTAAPRTSLVSMNLPRGLLYALGGDRAVQVWYRDTTLAMVSFTRLAEDSTLRTIAGVQFQLNAEPQVVLLSPGAMRAQDEAYRHIHRRNWQAGLTALERADALEPDSEHRVFHGNNAGYRAQALFRMGRFDEAERAARRALSLDERDQNGYAILATTLLLSGRADEAAAVLERARRFYAGESWLQKLRADAAAARGRPSGP